MGDVLTFTPCPKLVAPPPAPEPLTAADPALRARIEAAAEVAQRLIAILDRMDGEPDLEDGGDAEPSLAAPEGHDSQVPWLRGGDGDREAEAGEAALPEVVVETVPPVDLAPGRPAAIVIPPDLFPVLRWGGRGNVVAAGMVLLDMVAGGER